MLRVTSHSLAQNAIGRRDDAHVRCLHALEGCTLRETIESMQQVTSHSLSQTVTVGMIRCLDIHRSMPSSLSTRDLKLKPHRECEEFSHALATQM